MSSEKKKKNRGEQKHLVKTSQEKHNGHNKNKNQFCLNIYLSNEPLNIPFICASEARDGRELSIDKLRNEVVDIIKDSR